MNFLYSLDLKNIFEGSVGSIAFAVYVGAFGWICSVVKRFKLWPLRWKLPRRASLSERVVRARELLGGRSIATFKLDTVLASLGLSAIVMAVYLYVRLSAMMIALTSPSLAKLMEAAALSIALFGSILVSLLIVNVARVHATLVDFRAHEASKKIVSQKAVETVPSKVGSDPAQQHRPPPAEATRPKDPANGTTTNRGAKS
ncbi:hypothetical protein [Rhizobium paknamense]|uniref:DUF4282 domain-containing protein n=2 Tax=Rhizobium TaxID=379 RepID=A0ABU0IIR9_9HYPH|nr:hypothetical protein [Rhizobium paknamense]MDQ0457567.1 hypothetical protein [Rhizobium paknamense]